MPESQENTESSHNENSHNYLYWLIPSVIAMIMSVAFILYEIYFKTESWISDSIGLLGSIASLAGVFFALYQIKQANMQIKKVSKISVATQQAVENNRTEIRKFLSFSNMGHLIEIIKNTQNYVRSQDYKLAVILMQDIKDDMLRVNSELKEMLSDRENIMQEMITKINIDIQSLVSHSMQNKQQQNKQSTLKPDVIHKNLEEAREFIIKIESDLKQDKI